MTALTSVFDRWTHPNYERRVRVYPPTSPIYLWGSAGITQAITFAKPPNLHIRNDVFGQPILLSTTAPATATTPSTTTVLGTLQPGECVSIQLQNISGVTANCQPAPGEPPETTVACIIRD
jgi:multidrug efflux pump subunit AcrA (membrane-fusion protein)